MPVNINNVFTFENEKTKFNVYSLTHDENNALYHRMITDVGTSLVDSLNKIFCQQNTIHGTPEWRCIDINLPRNLSDSFTGWCVYSFGRACLISVVSSDRKSLDAIFYELVSSDYGQTFIKFLIDLDKRWFSLTENQKIKSAYTDYSTNLYVGSREWNLDRNSVGYGGFKFFNVVQGMSYKRLYLEHIENEIKEARINNIKNSVVNDKKNDSNDESDNNDILFYIKQKQEFKNKCKSKINKKFVVGKHYYLRSKVCDGSTQFVKEFELKKIIWSVNEQEVNSLVVKQLSGPNNSIFTLNKHDCKKFHIKYEPGLQVFTMEMNWIPKNENYG